MATSRRWKALRKEVAALRRLFLPEHFDPLGVYHDFDRVQAHTRAFIVLSHAELESYLEAWAKDIVRACETVWTSTGRITQPFAFLLATMAERIEVTQTLVDSRGKDTPARLSEASVKLFEKCYKQIKNNHGIKEKNFWSLFAPLGLPSGVLSSTLLPNLDSLGELRGRHAHESIRAVRNVLDPETEYRRVSDLVDELNQLDEWLVKYKSRIR